jgi:hypothetical protein
MATTGSISVAQFGDQNGDQAHERESARHPAEDERIVSAPRGR